MVAFGVARILIADDNPRVRALLRHTFAAEDYDVADASNGDEAVIRVAAHRPVVAILDVEMPGRSGLDVCRAIRADPQLEGTGIVVISANSSEDAAMAAGADAFMAKPFSPTGLVAVVAELIDRRRTAR